MPINKEPATPPPMIGKIGPYTVFVTPPPTPKPSQPVSAPPKTTVSPLHSPPPVRSPPPVLPPPSQYYKSAPLQPTSFDFFWNAVAKVQNAHSNLDAYVAHWFGLNQSKYQWALDDYYEMKGGDQVDAKGSDVPSKAQTT